MKNVFENKNRIMKARFTLEKLRYGGFYSEDIERMTDKDVLKETRYFSIIANIAGLYCLFFFVAIGMSIKESKSPPVITEYGDYEIIENITVHHTSFSTDSTVKTNHFTYQVRGAVSAAVGDQARRFTQKNMGGLVKRDEHKLCVENEVSDNCFYIIK